jgi:outer membrane protein TolC
MRRMLWGLIGMAALASYAQSADAPPSTLTWADCVTQASRSNPDLRSALEAMEASRSQYKGSFNGILPQLNLSNSYTDTSSTHDGFLATGIAGTVTTESKSWQAQASANLDLIDFGQWAAIRSFAAASRQAQANFEVASTNVLLNLYKAFTATLYSQEAIRVDTDIRDTWKSNAQMIALRYDSGAESKGNKMNTQASLLQAEAGLMQAKRDLETAQQQLGQVMGMDEFSALSVTGTWSAPAAPPEPNFDALLAKIPQIRAQQAVVDQARAAVKSAHSTLWPTLAVNYSKGVEGRSEFPTNPFWVFSGVVNYPLFGGGPTFTYYASQAAQHSYEKAELDLRSLHNQTLSTLRSAWSSYAQAQDQVQVQGAFLAAAKQRKDESDINYQSGLMTFANWIIVINDYVNFQTSFLRAEQNLILAEAQWRFASGQQLGD